MSNTTIKRRYNAVYLNNDKIIDISNSTTDASEVILGNLFYNPDGTQGTGSLDLNNMYSDLKATNNTAGTYIYNKLPLNDNNDNELSNSTEYIRNILDSISHIDITNTGNAGITTNMDSYANGYRSVAFNTKNYAGSKGFYGVVVSDKNSAIITLSLTDKEGNDSKADNPLLEKFFEIDNNPKTIADNSKILIQSVTEAGKDIREIHILNKGIYTSDGKYIIDLTNSGTNFDRNDSAFISIINNPNFGLTYGESKDIINNFAIGYANKALGKESFTAGSSNIGYGLRSATFGYLNTNGGVDTFISGAENNILFGSANSIVSGNNNTLSAANSLAIGIDNTISGSNSFVLGYSNILTKVNSMLIGNNLESTSENQLIVGNSNKKNESGIFIVSNGSQKNLINVNDSNTTITLPTVIDNTLDVKNNITGETNLTIKGSTTLGNQKTVDRLNVVAISDFKGNTTIGESTDKLTVNADSEFNNNVKANANMIIGSGSEDTLTVNSVTTHNAYTEFEKNVKVLGNSSLYGPATNIGDSSADELLVKSHAIFKDTVKLDATFASKNTLEVNGSSKLTTLNVTGSADLDSTLNVDGNATFNTNVTIGDIRGQDLLSVKARSTFLANTNLYGGTTTIGDGAKPDENLNINAILTSNNIAKFKKTTTFDDDVFVNKNLTIGDTLAQDKLTVNSASVFKAKTELYGSQTIIGDSKNDTLSVTATSTFNNPVTLENTTLTANGNVALNANTTIGDTANDTLTVNAHTEFKDNVILSKDFNNDENESTLAVEGLTTLNRLRVQGTAIIGDNNLDTLTVNSTSTFKNPVTLEKTLTVNKDAALKANTTIGDNTSDILTVNSTPTFNNGLTVNGKTILKDSVELGSDSKDDLIVHAESEFDEAVKFNKNVNIEGNTTIGTSGETDELTINAMTSIHGKTKIIGETDFSGPSIINGTTTFNGDMVVAGNITFEGNNLTKTFVVNNESTFNKNINAESLIVDKESTFNERLLVGSNFNVSDENRMIVGDNNVKTDSIFVIGNGTREYNLFEVDYKGNVHINGGEGNVILNGQNLLGSQRLPIMFLSEINAYQFTNGLQHTDENYEAVTFSLSELKALKQLLNNNSGLAQAVSTSYNTETDELTFSIIDNNEPEVAAIDDDNVSVIETDDDVQMMQSETISVDGVFRFTNNLPSSDENYDYVDFTLSEFKILKALISNNLGFAQSVGTEYDPESNTIIFDSVSDKTNENS